MLKGKCSYCKKRISIRYFSRSTLFSNIYFSDQLEGPTEVIGYFFCCVCILIALMDLDSYEVDLRILIILWALFKEQRWLRVHSFYRHWFYVYMMIYVGGKWIWKEEVFGMGDVYYLTALGAYFSVNQILCISAYFLLLLVVELLLFGCFYSRKDCSSCYKIPFTSFITISAISYLFSIQWILYIRFN